MARFQFSENRPTLEREGQEFERWLNAMADGGALPGRWGVMQALVETWTQQVQGPRWLGYGRHTLRSISLLMKYHRSKNPEPQKVTDPVRVFLDRENATTPEGMDRLGQLANVYLSTAYRLERLSLGPSEATDTLRHFQLSDGVDAYLGVHKWGEQDWISGLYVPKHKHAAFLQILTNTIWEVEGGQDLQLSATAQRSRYGEDESAFEISSIGAPDTYISEGAAQAHIDHMAGRLLAFRQAGISRRLLFHGPPGTGKTTLARQVARRVGDGRVLRVEADAIARSGATQVRDFLALLRPSVLLLDDLDRCKDAQELLHYLERAHEAKDRHGRSWAEGLVVIATVNAIRQVDPAALREGRFDEVIHVTEPAEDHRRHILAHYLERYPIPNGPTLEVLVHDTEGFSPVSIRELLQSVSIVGAQHYTAELRRIHLQRSLYSGEAVDQYLQRIHRANMVASA